MVECYGSFSAGFGFIFCGLGRMADLPGMEEKDRKAAERYLIDWFVTKQNY